MNIRPHLEKPEFRVRRFVEGEVVLDVLHHSGDDGPVHVVDQVDVKQDEDRGGVRLVEVGVPVQKQTR